MPSPPMAAVTHPKRSDRSSRRWTLLLVADDGRLRQAPHLKVVLAAGAAALTVALACALVFGALYRSARRQNADLTQHLEIARQYLAQARQQHQLLLAQAAIAGQHDSSQAMGQDPSSAEQTRRTAPPDLAPPAGLDSVEAQELSLSRNKGSRHFQIHFKLKNTAGDADPIAGYAFVVLCPQDQTATKGLLVVPDAPLEGERPGAYKKGRPFTITRYTTIRLDGRDPDPGRFATAQVVIYGKNGNLMLEKRFDLGSPDMPQPEERM